VKLAAWSDHLNDVIFFTCTTVQTSWTGEPHHHKPEIVVGITCLLVVPKKSQVSANDNVFTAKSSAEQDVVEDEEDERSEHRQPEEWFLETGTFSDVTVNCSGFLFRLHK
jgi:hypothetical protein